MKLNSALRNTDAAETIRDEGAQWPIARQHVMPVARTAGVGRQPVVTYNQYGQLPVAFDS